MRKPVFTGAATRSRMQRIAPLPEPEIVDPAALVRAYRAGEIDLVCVLGLQAHIRPQQRASDDASERFPSREDCRY